MPIDEPHAAPTSHQRRFVSGGVTADAHAANSRRPGDERLILDDSLSIELNEVAHRPVGGKGEERET